MKKLTRKLIDYLFYNFMVDILEENYNKLVSYIKKTVSLYERFYRY